MASSLSIATLILCLSMINPSSGSRYGLQDATLIDKICRDGNVQPFYDLCAQIFRSDPRGSSSDLRGLAKIALEQSGITAMRSLVTIDDAARLGWGRTNNTVNVKLGQCSDRYGQIIYDVSQGFKALKNGDFNAVDNNARAIIGQANGCLDRFVGPSVVYDSARKLHNLGVIVAVISSLSGS
ncbi:Pectinesterase inhibitor [Linum grandiflorum]